MVNEWSLLDSVWMHYIHYKYWSTVFLLFHTQQLTQHVWSPFSCSWCEHLKHLHPHEIRTLSLFWMAIPIASHQPTLNKSTVNRQLTIASSPSISLWLSISMTPEDTTPYGRWRGTRLAKWQGCEECLWALLVLQCMLSSGSSLGVASSPPQKSESSFCEAPCFTGAIQGVDICYGLNLNL